MIYYYYTCYYATVLQVLTSLPRIAEKFHIIYRGVSVMPVLS